MSDNSPSWPRRGVVLLMFYCLVVGPAAFVTARRAAPASSLLVALLTSLLVAGACLYLGRQRATVSDTVVEVQTQGADGTVLTTAYRGLHNLDPSEPVVVPPGGASTVFSGSPVFASRRGGHYFLGSRTIALGGGGGAVATNSRRPAVHLGGNRPWELHTVQTVSIGDAGSKLEATLSVTGASADSPGRLQGTVTNRGAAPVRRLRAQIQGRDGLDGQARLADVVIPGETTQVDAPIVTATEVAAGGTTASREGMVMFAAAGQAFTGPSQVALVGATEPASTGRAGSGPGRVGIVVCVVPLQASDIVPPGSGGARLISASPLSGGDTVSVSDLSAPPGAGPLAIHYILPEAKRGQPGFGGVSYEVYDWTTGTWRDLPRAGFRPDHGFVVTPLAPPEVSDGLVRFRERASTSFFTAGTAKLFVPGPNADVTIG